MATESELRRLRRVTDNAVRSGVGRSIEHRSGHKQQAAVLDRGRTLLAVGLAVGSVVGLLILSYWLAGQWAEKTGQPAQHWVALIWMGGILALMALLHGIARGRARRKRR